MVQARKRASSLKRATVLQLLVSILLAITTGAQGLLLQGLRRAFRGVRRVGKSPKFRGLAVQEGSVVRKEAALTSVGIMSLVRDPRNIETWLDIHRQLGIKHFYISVEDSPGTFDYLDKLPFVTAKKSKVNGGVDEWWNLMGRQGDWDELAIWAARNDLHGVKWLVSMDADEILWGNLSVIENLPEKVRTFKLYNEEARYDKVPTLADNCFEATYFVKCWGQADPLNKKCNSYSNGKSGGRVAADVHPWGPHYMRSDGIKPGNSPWLEGIRIRHYDSCSFSKWKSKFWHLAGRKKHKKDPGMIWYHESMEAIRSNNIVNMYKTYKKYKVLTKGDLEKIKKRGLQALSSMSVLL
jgi:hypothetical protein